MPNAPKYKDYRRCWINRKNRSRNDCNSDHSHALPAFNGHADGETRVSAKTVNSHCLRITVLTETAARMALQHKWVIREIQEKYPANLRMDLVGTIGEVTEVDAWTNRPIWPQGLERPKEVQRVPKTLDWICLSGRLSSDRITKYTLLKLARVVEFGTGALGDMACHILDPFLRH
jgi:hypothetical protein